MFDPFSDTPAYEQPKYTEPELLVEPAHRTYDPFGDETYEEFRARVFGDEPARAPVATADPPEVAPVVRAPSKPAAPATAKPAAKNGGREVRKPTTQNEHLWCLVNIRGLSPAERAIAFTLHALCYVSGGRREAAEDYLAKKVEVSDRTVRTATKRLVALGLFDRLDNKKGGRGGRGRATYRPMVPTWWQAPEAKGGN